MSFGKEDGGITGDGHSLKLLLLVRGLGVVYIVQGGNPGRNPFLEVQKAGVVHLAVHGRMPCGALLHELRKHAGVVGLFPLFGNMAENALTLGLALPVGDDITLIGIYVLLGDVVLLKLAGVQHVKVLHAVASELREGGNGLGLGAALPHYKFVRADIDGLFGANLIEVLCA